MKVPAFALAVLVLVTALIAPTAPEIAYPRAPLSSDDLVLIDAPHIYQGIDYPNGCESVSTVMALQYLGIDMDVCTFIDQYLECGYTPIRDKKGGNPNSVYLGDPRSPFGWGCYAPVIYRALRKFVPAEEYHVWTGAGISLESLCRDYIDRGIPVVVWATVGMIDSGAPEFYAHWTTPEGRPISYNTYLHCLLLVGYDRDHFYFNDPLVPPSGRGKVTAYPKDAVEVAYNILGCQSVVIVPTGETVLRRTEEQVQKAAWGLTRKLTFGLLGNTPKRFRTVCNMAILES